MKLYLVWWTWCDGWNSFDGLIGVFSTEERAVEVAKSYEDMKSDRYAGSRVTETIVDDLDFGADVFSNVIHTFEDKDSEYDEEEENDFEDD